MTTKQNGPDAANIRPVKTLSQHAIDFIATLAIFASSGVIFAIVFAAVLVRSILALLGVLS